MKHTRKILLVDDDALFLESLSDLLSIFGFRVLTASNGRACLEIAHREQPDLVVLDLAMETRTAGIETAGSIRNNPQTRNIPVIILTASRHLTGQPAFLDTPINDLPADLVLDKPIDPGDLVARIESLMKRTESKTHTPVSTLA